MKCSSGFICQNGICVKDPTIISTCPADAKYKTTLCNDPRPDDKTCPVINYIKKPDPLFCGVKADGTRVDFPRDCECCKDKNIVYYFSTPCSQAPLICKAD